MGPRIFVSIVSVMIIWSGAINPVHAQTYSLMGSGCNDKVYSVAAGAPGSNDIFAAGEFTNAGGSQVNYIARWDGNSWNSVDGGSNFRMRCLLRDNNMLYAGGGFNMVGSGPVIAWSVAGWDGSSWSNLGNGIRGGDIYSLALYGNELYAGGLIDTLSGFNPGRGILKWNGSAWVSLGGNPGDGVSGPPGFKVKAMVVYNGQLFVGGSFDAAGGNPANNIARWNGTGWSAVGGGTNGEVNALIVHNGDLYLGGDFTDAGGTTVSGLARYDGASFSDVGGGVNGSVNGFGIYNNTLHITGSFTTAGSVSVQNIAGWDGTSFSAAGLGLNFDGYCLTPFNGDLYIGGFFTVAGTVFANNIVKYNAPVGFEDFEELSGITYGPVPAHSQLEIFSEESLADAVVTVSDSKGRVTSKQVISLLNSSGFRLDLSGHEQGVYLCNVTSDKKSFSFRFTKL